MDDNIKDGTGMRYKDCKIDSRSGAMENHDSTPSRNKTTLYEYENDV